jgi:hypothetical protein
MTEYIKELRENPVWLSIIPIQDANKKADDKAMKVTTSLLLVL